MAFVRVRVARTLQERSEEVMLSHLYREQENVFGESCVNVSWMRCTSAVKKVQCLLSSVANAGFYGLKREHGGGGQLRD